MKVLDPHKSNGSRNPKAHGFCRVAEDADKHLALAMTAHHVCLILMEDARMLLGN